MADVNTAPRLSKKRKMGKNKKKSWRASKVEDIEEFLDDERRQIRTGGLVSEKLDRSLFVIDKSSKQGSDSAEPKSKRSLRNKPLKCLSLLQPDPHSKIVRKPDDITFQKGKRTERIISRNNERSRSQVRIIAEKQRQKWKEEKLKEKIHKKQLPVVTEDLWLGSDINLWTGLLLFSQPTTLQQLTSALSATHIPHPGTSINPSYDDHQDLLLLGHLKEEQRIKNEKKILNALKFPSKEDAPDEFTYMVEMSAGLVDDTDEEDDLEEEGVDAIPVSANPPVRREDRKTKRQKRNEKVEEEKAKKRAMEEKVKKRENMVLRIPSLKSEINKAERQKSERQALKQKKKEEEKFKTKRLGLIKFEEPDLDLKLSSELVASLREVKPEGHPLQDVYKSMQRRNIIEPRIRQKRKRKYKLKTFEKKGHKEVTL
ncbi:unnamed protein product [Lymnaea stagnalis]|uniref:Ribosome biogenesis protein NOP53 n=1 Tax=Lymnaea stagnalis TaxID=6523 RepID=A0AAV2H1M6_LYMST